MSLSDTTDGDTILTPPTEITAWSDPNHKTIRAEPSINRDAVPCAGNTYLIMDKATGRVITLVHGQLYLQPGTSDPGSCHWICTENNGWLGFRNEASGTYIGHDGEKRMRASQLHHSGWEYIATKRCPDGGYHLLVMHWEALLKVTAFWTDGWKFVAREGDGTVREFIKV